MCRLGLDRLTCLLPCALEGLGSGGACWQRPGARISWALSLARVLASLLPCSWGSSACWDGFCGPEASRTSWGQSLRRQSYCSPPKPAPPRAVLGPDGEVV